MAVGYIPGMTAVQTFAVGLLAATLALVCASAGFFALGVYRCSDGYTKYCPQIAAADGVN